MVQVQYMFTGGIFDVNPDFSLEVSPAKTVSETPAAVPEPGTFALCSLAVGGAARLFRRRKR
jgi:hypothetical protein